jgi:L-threonylcarbamoyladenylate synthase
MYGRVDVIIDGGESEIGLESTIVSLDGDKAVLLRPGGITVEMLREVTPGHRNGQFGQRGIHDGRPSAPGMKYRHYAPDAPVYLLDGEDKAAVYELDNRKSGGACSGGQESRESYAATKILPLLALS